MLVGLDGPGGCGKSTLSQLLASAGENVSVVQMDDFYKPSSEHPTDEDARWGEAFDWQRLRRQVLEPLRNGSQARYQRYDWDRDAMADWLEVPPGGLVVVEGVYCTRSELADFYDFKVWVQCPSEVRLERGVARDGEEARDQWLLEWMPAEDEYASQDEPHKRADLILDGTGLPSEPGAPSFEVTFARDPA